MTLGFRDEFTTGWNEAHGRASTYTYHEWRDLQSADDRQFGVHCEQREVPAAAARRAGLESVRQTHATVIRAGFGMYNDLQDALGYRTDQNAPFNPTYSLAERCRSRSFRSRSTRQFRQPRSWFPAACSRICRRRL